MNLALKDIRHHFGRFALTTIGLGLLLMVVMGMGGIYRGLVTEATLLVDTIHSDLWVVQHSTLGPFAEMSRIPRNVVDRVAAVPGIVDAREFVFHTIQRNIRGKTLRMSVLGLSWPVDKGEWLPIKQGRPLASNHFEMIADKSLGFGLNEKVRFGKDTYTVVGITEGMSGMTGDGLIFFTLQDAQSIQFDLSGEAIRREKTARAERVSQTEYGTMTAILQEKVQVLPSSEVPVLGPPAMSAVIANFAPGTDPQQVMKTINGWSDVSAYTYSDQKDLVLKGLVDKVRRQIGLFRILLAIISAIIMALILYTLTLDKLHDIALLKLIGAPTRVVLSIILQQALILGVLAYGLAFVLGRKIFPLFPRRVVLLDLDLILLAIAVLILSVVASLLGIWRAIKVQPNEALMG